ncbi:cupin domain-containing protein [Halosegnis sp.]|uniref:cupin domain-containing protein n=1 Tax=Halosegnis sp. TaxID=2864959 RepID=UPI0035D43160
MQHVDLDELERIPHFMGVNSDRRPLARAIDAMGFAATYLELEPGEAFSGGPHTHTDQEELFIVLEGTATFETRPGPGTRSETTEVGPMGAVHFEAGDVFQQGRNESNEPVVGLAIGVGADRHAWDGVEALVDCPDCGTETVHSLAAPEADDERMPAPERVDIICETCGNQL